MTFDGGAMKCMTGDLLEFALRGDFDVIVHGCNCFHNMSAGIAAAIAQAFPEALSADKATSLGERSKLGTISTARIERASVGFVVVNAYTQFTFQGPGPHVDYDAVSRCFIAIADAFPSARIGYPRIGAGLAGGNWTILAETINARLKGLDHTLVEFAG